jgi:glycosyltransferase involved in cell wall biosynthesis/DNA-binding beta-propeller fold protein YncE
LILGKRIVVVMPAYNAETTLRRTLDELPPGIVDEMVLVDDASRDNTAALARSLGVRTLVHRVNLGYGGNQKTCYTEALSRGADIAVMLHPDYQYDPRLVPSMASLIASGVYDVVLGSRIIGNGALKGGMPRYKYVANRMLTMFENLLLGEKLSEYHTGYRAFSREVLETLPLEANSNDFVFDNEILAQIFFFGFRVGEVSCPTRYEPQSSSINFRRSCKYGFGVLWTAIRYRLARLGWMTSPLFSASSPRLDRDRTRSRLLTDQDSASPSAAIAAPDEIGAPTTPIASPPKCAVEATDSHVQPSPPGSPLRLQPDRRSLQVLLGVLLLAALVPVLLGWRLISAYAAIPTIPVQVEKNLVVPIINGQGLAVNSEGTVYLAESGGRRLIAFPRGSAEGAMVLAPRAGQGELRTPFGLALGPDDNLYLLDQGTGNVHVYNQNGAAIRTMSLGSHGARAIALDDLGNIYIGDTGAGVIRKFRPDGTLAREWGDERTPGMRSVGPVTGLAVIDGALYAGVASRLLCLDASGNIAFDRQTIGNAGTLTVGPGKTLIASDTPTHRVWVYNTDGDVIARIGGDGDRTGTFNQPSGVAASDDGSRLYAVNGNRVTVYDLQWPFGRQ